MAAPLPLVRRKAKVMTAPPPTLPRRLLNDPKDCDDSREALKLLPQTLQKYYDFLLLKKELYFYRYSSLPFSLLNPNTTSCTTLIDGAKFILLFCTLSFASILSSYPLLVTPELSIACHFFALSNYLCLNFTNCRPILTCPWLFSLLVLSPAIITPQPPPPSFLLKNSKFWSLFTSFLHPFFLLLHFFLLCFVIDHSYYYSSFHRCVTHLLHSCTLYFFFYFYFTFLQHVYTIDTLSSSFYLFYLNIYTLGTEYLSQLITLSRFLVWLFYQSRAHSPKEVPSAHKHKHTHTQTNASKHTFSLRSVSQFFCSVLTSFLCQVL